MKDKRNILFSGFALFSMFFGAGNLLFPPVLGRNVGYQFIPASLGFLTTGVGLVMLGVIATVRAGGTIDNIANKIGEKFSSVFGTIILIAIGPGLAIPRTAATTYEIFQGSILEDLNPLISSLIFFAIVLFFVLRPKKIVNSLGKFLTPILLIVLGLIIFKAISTPLGPLKNFELKSVFTSSFIEGYQTMDALATLVFTKIIIDGYRNEGIKDEKIILSSTVKSAIIAAIGLSIIYSGLLYMGATASSLNLAEMGRSEFLIYTTRELLGYWGNLILAIAMSLACLTTAIGLTATVGEFFNNLTKGKLPYSLVVIISSLFSGFFAVTGVDSIVAISAPILSSLYPVVIILIFSSVFKEVLGKRSTQIGAVIGAIIPSLGIISGIFGKEIEPYFFIRRLLPESFGPFVWVIPSIILAIIFTIFKIGEKDIKKETI